jgi:hypothetical protein
MRNAGKWNWVKVCIMLCPQCLQANISAYLYMQACSHTQLLLPWWWSQQRHAPKMSLPSSRQDSKQMWEVLHSGLAEILQANTGLIHSLGHNSFLAQLRSSVIMLGQQSTGLGIWWTLVLGYHLGQHSSSTDRGFRAFPWSLLATSRIVLRWGLGSFRLIHHLFYHLKMDSLDTKSASKRPDHRHSNSWFYHPPLQHCMIEVVTVW